MSPKERHIKTYQAFPSKGIRIVCSCGWTSPNVDELYAAWLGIDQKLVESIDQNFAEHLAEVGEPARSTASDPAKQRAIEDCKSRKEFGIKPQPIH